MTFTEAWTKMFDIPSEHMFFIVFIAFGLAIMLIPLDDEDD